MVTIAKSNVVRLPTALPDPPAPVQPEWAKAISEQMAEAQAKFDQK